MHTIPDHPMDDISVRPLQFDMQGVSKDDLVWSRSCPAFSVFLNAFGLHVPYFERYLIRAMRAAKPDISDEGLRREISAIIGQEAHHARNFIALNEAMAAKYPKIGALDASARDYFERHANTDSRKRMVGFTAGYETFTFVAGAIILQNHARWLADSDPTINAMWVWHQVEEVEHGAVAFDVYRALYGEHEMYRKWMVLVAGWHAACETVKTYSHIARMEGWLRNPFRAISRFAFLAKIIARLALNALPVLRRDYHPRKHPLVTTAQSPIQIAWRRYEKAGGNVLAIDHAKMAEILGVAEPKAEHAAGG